MGADQQTQRSAGDTMHAQQLPASRQIFPLSRLRARNRTNDLSEKLKRESSARITDREEHLLSNRRLREQGFALHGPSGTSGAGVARQTQFSEAYSPVPAAIPNPHPNEAYPCYERVSDMPRYGLRALHDLHRAELEAQMTVRAGLNAHKTKEDAMKQRIAYQDGTAFAHADISHPGTRVDRYLRMQQGVASLENSHAEMCNIWDSSSQHPRHPMHDQTHALHRPDRLGDYIGMESTCR